MEQLDDLALDPVVALLVTDQQLDFEPGGALAVAGGDEIVSGIAGLMPKFKVVVMTQDSHPLGHISFASSYRGKKPYEVLTLAEVEQGKVKSDFTLETLKGYLQSVPGYQQVLWPDHCVPGTPGWQLDPRLPQELASLILRKGNRLHCDSYSCFFENDGTPTGLAGYLHDRGIEAVAVVGLAGDYCVYWTAKDAVRCGFRSIYVQSLTRCVGFPPESRELALKEMRACGVELR